jgi:hypothetical protein
VVEPGLAEELVEDPDDPSPSQPSTPNDAEMSRNITARLMAWFIRIPCDDVSMDPKLRRDSG